MADQPAGQDHGQHGGPGRPAYLLQILVAALASGTSSAGTSRNAPPMIAIVTGASPAPRTNSDPASSHSLVPGPAQAKASVPSAVRTRRARLHDAAQRAGQGAGVAWAELAADPGYADQSHLTREFTAMIGIPPARYAHA